MIVSRVVSNSSNVQTGAKMKRLIIAAISMTLAVPAFAVANDTIDKAAK